MALDAGSVYAVLGGRFMPGGFAQFDAAMKRSVASAAAAEKGITGSSTRSSAAMTALGTAARTGAAAGLLAVGVAAASSIKHARAFDKEMRNVNSIAKLNEAQFQKLSTSVLKLSGETAQAPVTLAKGVYQLVSSGFDAQESLSILESSAKAASAGLTTTEVATTAVAAVLNAYKRPASDAAQVSDDLFQTVNLGVLSFEQLASSIGDALPFAQSLGVGLKDVGAATSTMTKAGLSAPETMTRIKGAMTAMLKPSEDMRAAYEKLGVASGGELIRKTGSFQGALQALSGTVDNNKEAMAKLFPDIRGLGAALLLTGKNAKAANSDLSGFKDTAGVTDMVLAEQQKSLDYQARQLGANFQALGVTIGSSLIPPLTDAAQLMNDMMTTGGGAAAFGTAFQVSVDIVKLSVAQLAGIFGTLMQAMAGFVSIGRLLKIPGFKEAEQDLRNFGDRLYDLNNQLMTDVLEPKLSVSEAISELRKLDAVKLAPKVQRILTDGNTTAEQKIRRLRGLGIPDKVAKFLVSGDTKVEERVLALRALGIPTKTAKLIARDLASGTINQVKGNLGSLPSFKNITVTTFFKQVGSLPPLTRNPPRAAGRAAGVEERALVGEGGGPEYVINRKTGKSVKVSDPTIMTLGRDDYVIPTESKYKGRANQLLMALVQDLGLVGYKKGKAPKKQPPKKQPPKPSAPARGGSRGDGGRAAAEAANRKREQERAAAAKRKRQEGRRKILNSQVRAFSQHSLDWYDNEINKEEKYKDNKNKKKQLTERAKKARERLKKLRAEKKKAMEYKRKIDKATAEADIAMDDMRTADTQDNQGAFNEAWNRRKKFLADAIGLLTPAIAGSDKASTWNRELRAQLAKLRGDQADLGANPPPVDDGTTGATESTFTAEEQARLAQIEASIATAGLTTTIEDDRSALQSKIDFLTPILNAATASQGAGRGGFKAITEIANDLRSARDQLSNLTGGPSMPTDPTNPPDTTGPTPDQQALIDQARAQGLAQGQTSFIDRLAGATLQGSPTLVFQSYVPPSPTEAKRLADYTIGGIGFQGQSPSSTERVGV